MVAQKYGIATNRHAALPRSLSVMVMATFIGGVIEWYGQWNIAQLLIPLLAILIVCIVSVWVARLRGWCFVAGSMAIGVSVCARLVGTLPPQSSGAPPMQAWLTGTIEEVLSLRDGHIRCLVRATIDPKYLHLCQNIRALLSADLPRKHIQVKPGDRIVSTVLVHLPESSRLPGTISEWQYAASRNVQIIAHARKGTVAILPPSTMEGSLVQRARFHAKRLSDSIFTNPTTRLLSNAIVLGQREELGPHVRELFSKTGTAHLLSVSGFHVGVVATIVFLLTTAVRNKALRWILALGCIWSYILLTGASAPAVRAGIAASLAISVLFLQRWVHPLQGVIIGLWMMLWLEPRLLLSVSFQLSAAAVLGIVTIGARLQQLPLWNSPKSALVKYVRGSVSITVGATVASAPVVASYFGVVPMVGLLANILVVPLASLFILTSALSIVAGHIAISIGRFYAAVADGSASAMLQVIETLASLDLLIANPTGTIVVAAIALAIWYITGSRSTRHVVFRLSCSTLLVLLLWQIELYYSFLPSRRDFAHHGTYATVYRIDHRSLLVDVTAHPAAKPSNWFFDRLYSYCIEQHPERIYLRARSSELPTWEELSHQADGKSSPLVIHLQ